MRVGVLLILLRLMLVLCVGMVGMRLRVFDLFVFVRLRVSVLCPLMILCLSSPMLCVSVLLSRLRGLIRVVVSVTAVILFASRDVGLLVRLLVLRSFC